MTSRVALLAGGSTVARAATLATRGSRRGRLDRIDLETAGKLSRTASTRGCSGRLQSHVRRTRDTADVDVVEEIVVAPAVRSVIATFGLALHGVRARRTVRDRWSRLPIFQERLVHLRSTEQSSFSVARHSAPQPLTTLRYRVKLGRNTFSQISSTTPIGSGQERQKQIRAWRQTRFHSSCARFR